ncbi:MAG: ABC transporter substrate-binding protein [Desulfobacterales bacterium]|nr:ABC transporter substrate-binding protein [Desulfobacterales bacterium]
MQKIFLFLICLICCLGTGTIYASGVTITFLDTGVLGQKFYTKKKVEEWEKMTGNRVQMYEDSYLSSGRLGSVRQVFYKKSDVIDLLAIDVVWPGMLTEHLIDLKKYIPESQIKTHLKSHVVNYTDSKGHLLAIPYFTDFGLLFYRTDLLEKYGFSIPQTWDELKKTALNILKKENNSKLAGYVWQGKSYEGLTCNALEWIDSYNGGTIVDVDGNITINNPNAINAFETAKSWIGTITPEEVRNYAEFDSHMKFRAGEAVFLRNWPYVWSIVNNKDCPIRNKVGVAMLPKGGDDGKHSSTLGGWGLAVSKYSRHPEVTIELLCFLTTESFQIGSAIETGNNPTISSAYKNSKLLKKRPIMKEMYSSFTKAVPRPSTVTAKKYSKVSIKFWEVVSSILFEEVSTKDALEKLERDLKRIRGKNNWKQIK